VVVTVSVPKAVAWTQRACRLGLVIVSVTSTLC
jgi:hypothetical protein